MQGLAKCEAGLAMHRATGNTRSGLRSGLFVAEVLHRWGNNARAIALGMDLLREIRELGGYKLERGYQYCNLAAYHLADGATDRALEALLEAIELVPRDDTFWHWAMLQNAAGIEAAAGDPRRAARLMGFVDQPLRQPFPMAASIPSSVSGPASWSSSRPQFQRRNWQA